MDTAVAACEADVGPAAESPGGAPGTGSRVAHLLAAAAPPALGALPFIVLFSALVAERPRITAYGDRAVTALAVRDLVHGRQLLGAYSRYGWHHPGPAFFLPLTAVQTVLGGASWALDAGMLLGAAVPAGLIVALVGRRFGWRAGMVTAGAVGIYLHAISPVTLRDPWNPWGLLLPMAVLIVLCAGAGAGSLASLSGAVLVTTLLVQTHVGAAPLSVALLAIGAALMWWGRKGHPEPLPWGRASVIGPLVAAGALWIPPLVQQATGRDPNLSELWRFFIQGDPGHSLSTAVATVGSRLRLVPFGDQAGLLRSSPSVGWDRAGSGLATLAAYTAAGLLLVVIGHRARHRFAHSAGILTVGAVWASVIAVRSVQGPLDGFLVAWITAIPLGLAAGVGALIPQYAAPAEGGRRRGAVALTAGALAFGAVGSALATAAAAGAPPAATEDAPMVRDVWAQLAPHLGRRPGAVLLRVDDPYGWPVQAGLALLVEQHGWHAHVTDDWAFMFGPARRMTGEEPIVATLRAVTPKGPEETLTLDVSETFPPQAPEDLEAAAARMATILGGSVLFPTPTPTPTATPPAPHP